MMRRTDTGFSLIEFTAALIVVVVGALYVAPMYCKAINNYRASAYTNELVTALRYARTQAVTRAQTVSVCSSDNGVQCANTPWSHGYIVFLDSGEQGVVSKGDQVLKTFVAHNTNVTITLNNGKYVGFNASGTLTTEVAGVLFERNDTQVNKSAGWLDRLSPIGTANADEHMTEASKVNDAALSGGMFTVCVSHTGRTVKLSLQGYITTSDAHCR